MRLFWAAALGLVLSLPTVSAAAAEQPHWEFELAVDAPQTVGDSFRIHLVVRLQGPRVVTPQPVVTRYLLAATRPDGRELPMAGTPSDPATELGNAPGSADHWDYSFVPDQNGEWVFTVWRLDGGTRAMAVQRRVQVDKALVALPAGSGSMGSGTAGGTPLVADVRLDPARPVVGQAVNIAVQMGASRFAQGLGELPVKLMEDDGVHQIGVVTLSSGHGTLVWVPQQAMDGGELLVGDHLVPVVVLDASASPAVGNDADAWAATPMPADDAEAGGAGSQDTGDQGP